MVANIFTTIIVQPIFNLLVVIYALLPGHNFGLAIVLFTILIRIILWPLVKKQLNQAKAMRELAPEIKKIKQAAKGDRQKESQMTMELYREREVNPFASIGILLVQLPILIGLYSGLNRIIKDPHQIVSFSYSFVQHMPWINALSHNIHRFDNSLLGIVDLGKKAIGNNGIYWPALLLVAASAVTQYIQSKQLMPHDKEARGLRQILRDAGQGKQADQTEVNAAVGRGTLFLVPGMVFVFGLNFAAALPLYWFTSSVVAVLQQARILKEDVDEADASVPEPRSKSRLKSTEPSSAAIKASSPGLKVTRRTIKEPAKTNTRSKSSKRSNKRRRK
ncbi:MAG TPA: YidC/Oxa1 family membrane protein insertase [Candidatus Saccharimonadales bacterium]|nr:YidC/Oxa1 family membrane protein insertase [Candidatus Saccharimonadales bacterium]